MRACVCRPLCVNITWVCAHTYVPGMSAEFVYVLVSGEGGHCVFTENLWKSSKLTSEMSFVCLCERQEEWDRDKMKSVWVRKSHKRNSASFVSICLPLSGPLSFPPSFSLFLARRELPPGSGLGRMFSDRLSRQREGRVQTQGHPDCRVLSTGETQTEQPWLTLSRSGKFSW